MNNFFTIPIANPSHKNAKGMPTDKRTLSIGSKLLKLYKLRRSEEIYSSHNEFQEKHIYRFFKEILPKTLCRFVLNNRKNCKLIMVNDRLRMRQEL